MRDVIAPIRPRCVADLIVRLMRTVKTSFFVIGDASSNSDSAFWLLVSKGRIYQSLHRISSSPTRRRRSLLGFVREQTPGRVSAVQGVLLHERDQSLQSTSCSVCSRKRWSFTPEKSISWPHRRRLARPGRNRGRRLLLLLHIRHSVAPQSSTRPSGPMGSSDHHFVGESDLLDNFLENVEKNGRLQSRSELRDELLVAGHRFGDHEYC